MFRHDPEVKLSDACLRFNSLDLDDEYFGCRWKGESVDGAFDLLTLKGKFAALKQRLHVSRKCCVKRWCSWVHRLDCCICEWGGEVQLGLGIGVAAGCGVGCCSWTWGSVLQLGLGIGVAAGCGVWGAFFPSLRPSLLLL